MFKTNNKDTGVFTVNFEHISHFFLYFTRRFRACIC